MFLPSSQCTRVLLVALLAAGCRAQPEANPPDPRSTANASTPAAPSEAPSSPSSSPAPPLVMPYPRAAWRLANDDDLARVVLWFSHILVRHAGSRNEVPFVLGYWSSTPPPTTRTRDEALALAQQLAAQASEQPGRFAELARQYSEDLPSRDEGGALGGYKATVLRMWPQILDALAALKAGQSSQVVETKYGFHILYRSAPPPELVMGGSHIVIGHDNAPWLAVYASAQPPKRTREEALQLANDVYRLARAQPSRFAELARKYSEHNDAVAGGDFGEWSTREFSPFSPRSKRLSELQVGEVGAPIETHLGFEIVLRTPVRPRKQYRAHLLIFPFDELSDSAPTQDTPERARAWGLAEAAVRALARAPARLQDWDAGHSVLQWEEGKELAPLTDQLAQLQPGQITRKPVISEYGFVIAQRLPPDPVHRVEPEIDLPAPEQPDLAKFFETISAANARKFLPRFAARAQQELALTEPAFEQLRALHDVSNRISDDTPDRLLMPVVNSVLADTRRLLGEDAYGRYRTILNREIADILLGAPADSARERGF